MSRGPSIRRSSTTRLARPSEDRGGHPAGETASGGGPGRHDRAGPARPAQSLHLITRGAAGETCDNRRDPHAATGNPERSTRDQN